MLARQRSRNNLREWGMSVQYSVWCVAVCLFSTDGEICTQSPCLPPPGTFHRPHPGILLLPSELVFLSFHFCRCRNQSAKREVTGPRPTCIWCQNWDLNPDLFGSKAYNPTQNKHWV